MPRYICHFSSRLCENSNQYFTDSSITYSTYYTNCIRLRSLSTGAYRSNSGGMGAKKRAGAY